jgi:hypothetical protein
MNLKLVFSITSRIGNTVTQISDIKKPVFFIQEILVVLVIS